MPVFLNRWDWDRLPVQDYLDASSAVRMLCLKLVCSAFCSWEEHNALFQVEYLLLLNAPVSADVITLMESLATSHSICPLMYSKEKPTSAMVSRALPSHLAARAEPLLS